MAICSSSASSQVLAAKPESQCSQSSAFSKPPYDVDQQVKFLHLQAEVESLLQHLQMMKQQRLAVTSPKELVRN